MGLISDYEAMEKGRYLKDYVNTFDSELANAAKVVDGKKAVVPVIAHCQLMIDKMAALKVGTPTASIEIDDFITDKQQQLNDFKTANGL